MPPDPPPLRIALLVEPRLLVDLLRRQLERRGVVVLVDDATSTVDVVIASASRVDERPEDGAVWLTVPANDLAPTLAGSRGTLVADLDELLSVATASASHR